VRQAHRGHTPVRRRDAGFTLIEITVALSILVIVSLLMLMVTQSTTSAVVVSEAKEQAQASLRNALAEMTAELSAASKKTNASLTPALAAIKVVSPTEVTFQVPVSASGLTWSAPITYRFMNEDVGPNGNNARLDSGEDTNGDGALTRRIVRIQGGKQSVIGTANDISNVVFTLNAPQNDAVTITLTATKAVNNGRRRDLITATAANTVYLVN
jgi:prepilin-type N-terminal cleavage/methylation domain-containing protein